MRYALGAYTFLWGFALGLAIGAAVIAKQYRAHKKTLRAWRETLDALKAPPASLTTHDHWFAKQLAAQGHVMRPLHGLTFYESGFRVEGSSPKAIAESLAVLASGGRLP